VKQNKCNRKQKKIEKKRKKQLGKIWYKIGNEKIEKKKGKLRFKVRSSLINNSIK
jgi:hypothetical protein